MNISRRKIIGLAGAALLLSGIIASCAKEGKTGKNDAYITYFQSWMKVHHPEAAPTGLGIYIMDDKPGTGAAISDKDKYILVRYTTRDLDGKVNGTTEESIAKQTGSYSVANYYGDDIIMNDPDQTSAGIIEMLKGMKVGGTRKAIIPGWLNVAEKYDTAEDYLKKCTGTEMVCDLTVSGTYEDIYKWEIDTLERFVARHMAGIDSTYFGYYYKQTKAPIDTVSIPKDSTFCINYTGRLMNGKVFDTTIKDTAKVWGIYSSTKEYKPVYIKKNEDFTKITMASSSGSDGSTVVNGLSFCMSNLKKFEKGIVAFYSVNGYGAKGSGSAIPKYAPISFEIEVVADPDK